MGQPPRAHAPLGQVRAAGHLSERVAPLWAAKVENWRSILRDEQAGHATFWLALRTRISAFRPQSRQT